MIEQTIYVFSFSSGKGEQQFLTVRWVPAERDKEKRQEQHLLTLLSLRKEEERKGKKNPFVNLANCTGKTERLESPMC